MCGGIAGASQGRGKGRWDGGGRPSCLPARGWGSEGVGVAHVFGELSYDACDVVCSPPMDSSDEVVETIAHCYVYFYFSAERALVVRACRRFRSLH